MPQLRVVALHEIRATTQKLPLWLRHDVEDEMLDMSNFEDRHRCECSDNKSPLALALSVDACAMSTLR